MFDLKKSSRQRCDGLDPKHGKKMCRAGTAGIERSCSVVCYSRLAHGAALHPGVPLHCLTTGRVKNLIVTLPSRLNSITWPTSVRTWNNTVMSRCLVHDQAGLPSLSATPNF